MCWNFSLVSFFSLLVYVHKEVLQEKYQKIVDRLDFSKGHVLDELVQEEAISESDHENILKLTQKRKDQNRYIIHRFRHYDTDNFETFVNSLKEEYPDLSDELNLSYKEKLDLKVRRKCLFCMVIQTVDISDILDPLFENKLIDDTIIEQRLNGTSHDLLWRRLFHQIKDLPPGYNCKEVFVAILSVKYKDIAKAIDSVQFQSIFHCSCHLQKAPFPRAFETDGSGSLSDVSSTSECPISEKKGIDRKFYVNVPSKPARLDNIGGSNLSSYHPKEKKIDTKCSSPGSGNQDTLGLNRIDNSQHQSLLKNMETPNDIDKRKTMEAPIQTSNNEFETSSAQIPKPKSHNKSSDIENATLVDKKTTEDVAENIDIRGTHQRIPTIRQSSSFRMSSTFDRRRSGISVQQAEQFIRWTDQDPTRRDRRTPRYMTA